MSSDQIAMGLAQVLAWSVAGLVALFVSRMAYKLFTPFDERKELTEDQNAAVGASHGMYIIASAIILHGIIVGDRIPGVTWWEELLLMVGLYLGGLVLLWIGRLVLRLLVKFDLDEELHIKDNLAVGLVEGSSYVAFAIIIHAAL